VRGDGSVWLAFFQGRLQVSARVDEAKHADFLIGDSVVCAMVAIEKAADLFGRKP